jgi:hypothetical protein
MLMATNIRMALDPALIGERVGLDLDPWQQELLREAPSRGLRVIILAPRQSGKTTTCLLAALWTLVFEPDSLVLIVSPSLRQSSEAFRSFMALYHKLNSAPEVTRESTLRAEFSNGGRIISLPGTERTIRGYSRARLILLDEAARIEPDLIQALTPMTVLSNGSLIAMSTPFGRTNWFAETWHDENQDWHRIKVSADQCPRLTKEVLDRELKALGGLAFSEEFGLQFNDDQLAMFPTALIERAFNDPTVRPLWQ